MTVITQTIFLNTTGNTDVQDITHQLVDLVARNELASGILTVFCPSATSALTTIEYESGAIRDLRRLFEEIIPQHREYAHNERWHDGNGHTHIRAALLGPSLTIPFVDRKLTLGTWQQVVYVDFDVRPRQRQLIVQLIGG
jgi:secondary thiamine-phosphate synthase enzyme